MNDLRKKIFLFLFAGIIVMFSMIVLDLDSLNTSVIDAGDQNAEHSKERLSTPQYGFRTGYNAENTVGDGRSYDFGLIKAGTLLEGKAELNLVDKVASTFFINLVAASSFEGSDLVRSWVRLPGGNSIRLDAGSGPEGMAKNVDFQIQVPKDLLPGDYSLMLQAALDDYEGKKAATGAVTIKLGVGFLLRFAIAGERIYDMEFKGFSYDGKLLDDVGNLDISIGYNNNGNTILRPHYKVNINSIGGISQEAIAEIKPCDPGEICNAHIVIKEIKGLNQFDKVDVKGDLSYINPDTGANVIFATFNFTHYIIPWFYMTMGPAIFAILVILIFIFRGRKLYLKADCYEYKVQDGDTLENISKNLTADPKKIILANDLKTPFFLTVGSTILIPNVKNAKSFK